MNFVNIIAAAEGHAETAVAESGQAGLFESLGLDIKQLAINTIAFLILVGILARFVYPALIKAIDGRREAIENSLEAAKKSQEASEDAEKRVEALLADARKDADEIVARSQSEAQAMIAEAEAKAKQRADQLVADARSQLDAEVVKARAALKKDTLKLVAAATEKIVEERLDADKDAKLIESAIAKEAGGKA
jgi:F-type H+-transporting ATPase subunit b